MFDMHDVFDTFDRPRYLDQRRVTDNLAAVQAQSDAREAQSDVELMQHQFERLLIITESLWNLLKKEHGYQDDVLVKMMTEVDLRDGRHDGKVAKSPPRTCSKCQRTLSARHVRCLYCGEVTTAAPFQR